MSSYLLGSTNSRLQGTSSTNNDVACFECNICFDLAQDPIVTLCGHLFCWPCLYKWLRVQSFCPPCPVCKAIIEVEKLVPLYGRGMDPSDPRSKPMDDEDIPHRPTGQRPETALQTNLSQIPLQIFSFSNGYGWGNFAFSFEMGNPFNYPMHAFPNAVAYAPHPPYPFMFHNPLHNSLG